MKMFSTFRMFTSLKTVCVRTLPSIKWQTNSTICRFSTNSSIVAIFPFRFFYFFLMHFNFCFVVAAAAHFLVYCVLETIKKPEKNSKCLRTRRLFLLVCLRVRNEKKNPMKRFFFFCSFLICVYVCVVAEKKVIT